MESIRFPGRVVGTESLQFVLFSFVAVLLWGGSAKLFAAPQGLGEQGQEPSPRVVRQIALLASPAALIEEPKDAAVPTAAPAAGQARASVSDRRALNWESEARLHRGLEESAGTLTLNQDGVAFRPAKGAPLHWPFLEIQTFDLLTPQHLVITGYENRSWHRYGDRKYRFDLSTAMPPDVAAELAQRVAKPVRNGDPNPTATVFATIPARHRTLAGGTNGTLHFGPDGIDYVTTSGKSERAWRWADIQTLANPDPFQLRVDGYRETFTFELKQPMSRELFGRLWDQIEARDLNRLNANGSKENR